MNRDSPFDDLHDLLEIQTKKLSFCDLLRADVIQKIFRGIGGGGGFFLACEDFGRMFDHSVPACACFLLFFKVEISSRKLVCFIDNMIIECWVIETVWFVNS